MPPRRLKGTAAILNRMAKLAEAAWAEPEIDPARVKLAPENPGRFAGSQSTPGGVMQAGQQWRDERIGKPSRPCYARFRPLKGDQLPGDPQESRRPGELKETL